jgi:predicted molibdopterin-dependent oxidoreductase YjgC
VLEEDIALIPEFKSCLANLDLLIVHSSEHNSTTDLADIVLSISTYAEKQGTFVNFQGRVQRIRPAISTIDQDRALDGFAMSRWDKFASHNDRWGRPVKKDARPSWRILLAIGNALGTKWKYSMAEDVFKELSERNGAFKGMTYWKMGSNGAVLSSVREPVASR